MIQIPDLPGLQSSAVNDPQASTASAAAPAAALGTLAQSIASVGTHFQETADRVQSLENARVESQKRQDLARSYSNLQLELDKDPDPKSRITKTQDFFSQQKGAMDDPSLPPAVRYSLNQHFDEFSTQGMIQTTHTSATLALKRTTEAYNNEIATALQNGDGAGAHQAIDRIAGTGAMTPEEIDAARRTTDQTLRLNADQKAITEAPLHWMENNDPTKIPAGYNAVQWNQQQQFAKGKLREVTMDAVDTVQAGIMSGQVSSREQIDQMTHDVRPAIRQEMYKALEKNASEGFKAMASMPEYQAATVGKVSAMLGQIDTRAGDADVQMASADNMVRDLPPGSAARTMLEGQIRDLWEGKSKEPKTHIEAAMKSLDEAYKFGLFGKVPKPGDGTEEMTTARVLDSGFLANPAKLASLGLTADQVEGVMNAAPSPNSTDPKDIRANQAARLTAFRALAPAWDQRQNITAGPLEQAAAEAILNNQGTVKYRSPEATRQAAMDAVDTLAKYGQKKTDFAKWAKLNPDATPKEVDDKIFEMAGAETQAKLTSGIYDVPAPRGNAVTGDRITSFGYAGDSTPDSNSKVGIGANVSNEEARLIRAGAAPSVTPNKMKAGDFAVSGDVERQFEHAGIKLGDRVNVKMADGSTITGRWMDRTAPSFNGQTLTHRFDLYSPTGKSQHDGKAVTGWERANTTASSGKHFVPFAPPVLPL